MPESADGRELADFDLELKYGMADRFRRLRSIVILALLTPIAIFAVSHIVPSANAVNWLPEKQATAEVGVNTYPTFYRVASGTLLMMFTTNQLGPFDIWVVKSFNNGTTWSPSQAITTGPPDHAGSALTTLRNGTLMLFYSSAQTGNFRIVYRISNDQALTWGPELNTTFPNNPATVNFRAAALVATDGTIWVVWHSQVSGVYSLYYATSSNGGTTWVGPTRLTASPVNDFNPSIAQAPDGRIWVTWDSARAGSTSQIFAKYWNGTVWSSDQQLTFDSSNNVTPSLTIADDGTFWMVWDTDRNKISGTPINEIYYKYSYDNGLTWSADNQGTTDLNHPSTYPSILQIGPGNFGVAYDKPTSTFDNNIFYSQLTTTDLGVVSVSPSPNVFPPDALVNVYVTLKNHGATTETFTTSLYANSTLVSSYTTTLAPGTVRIWSPTWNTHGMPLGRYYLKASIPAAAGETDLLDNQLTTGPVWLRIPDVAVTGINTAYNWVYQGNNATAAITVQNLDSTPTAETFAVQLLVDGSPVSSTTVSNLAQSASRTVHLAWITTTSTTYGNHTFAAYAVPIAGEINTANNLLNYNNMKVLLPGDINQDAKVNTVDFFILLGQLGKTPTTWDPFWGPRCDINNDGKINTVDAYILIGHLGQTASY